VPDPREAEQARREAAAEQARQAAAEQERARRDAAAEQARQQQQDNDKTRKGQRPGR
jgi:peptidoglycan hydrolase CwlO-like protein